MKQTLRTAILLTFACAAVAAFSNFAQAQKVDIAFGGSTTLAPAASTCSGACLVPASLAGGTFLGFSGDAIFWHNLGVGAEVNWRASQASGTFAYGEGINYRPVFYNINAVYSPKIASHAYLELVAGIGAMDTHLYECDECQISGGASEVGASSHFDGDFGGGLKLYVKHGFFIRPEARFYLINNDTNYAGNHATRVGASIGYTFGGGH